MKSKLKRMKKPDRVLLLLLGSFVVIGFFIFLSASLGMLASGSVSLKHIVFTQFMFGIVLGTAALFITSRINYKEWRRYIPILFILSFIATLLVFLPGVGMTHGGASRWVYFAGFTFQPVELLKIGSVLLAAHLLAMQAKRMHSHTWLGLGMLVGIVGFVSVPLLLQPDNGSLMVIAITISIMFFAAGLQWRHIGVVLVIGAVAIASLIFMRPYILERVTTFINPTADAQGSGWQIKQSLIAVGSGGMLGRGFGQSVQKFNYLPEPVGDSIFAVYSEEFGFVGSSLLLLLLFSLLLRMLWLVTKAPDMFSALYVLGIAMLIGVQSLFNIAAMLGAVPLSGLPLIFVSHGGTAMIVALASFGIVLNISRYRKA